ncbi:N-acetylmuramoyl-L-alanine amidase [bacterium]|nr:N-acetylmuramoyl-L-alanine amidase [bacterium]
MRRAGRGQGQRERLGALTVLSVVLAAWIAPVHGARTPPAALYRAGYEMAPEVTRIWVTVNRSNWPAAPRPSISDGAVVVVFPGLEVHDQLDNLSIPNDTLVREVRFSRASGGAVMRILCRPGVTPQATYLSERDAFFVEIARPSALRPPPQVTAEELRRLKESGVKIVVLDPGHGGRDPGTRGHGMIEKTEVLELCRVLQKRIEEMGAGRVRVFLTRTGDYNLGSLSDDRLLLRIKKAAELSGDLFLSVHLNQFSKPSVSGWEIHVPQSYADSRLAGMLQRDPAAITDHAVTGEMQGDDAELKHIMLKQLQDYNEAYDPSGQWADVLAGELRKLTEISARGKRTTNKFVTGNLGMPSVLLEVAYLSNAGDARLVRNERFRQRLATAVGAAVLKYLFEGHAQLAQAPPPAAVKVSAAASSSARQKPSPPAPARPAYHKVKKGETISEIAGKYGVSATALLRANGLTPRSARRLQEGQKVRIP